MSEDEGTNPVTGDGSTAEPSERTETDADDSIDATDPDGTNDSNDEPDLGERDDDPESVEGVDGNGRATTESVDLESRVEALEAELSTSEERVADLESRLKRKQADFQNYKKRQRERQRQLEQRATEDIVERLLDVRDNLKRALDGEYDDVDALREGVEMTLAEFDRVLEAENVTEIDPRPGDEVDPQRHEVMLRVETDQPEGTIADVYQPGYELGGKVLRAAQVTVSDGSGVDDETDDDGTVGGEEETSRDGSDATEAETAVDDER